MSAAKLGLPQWDRLISDAQAVWDSRNPGSAGRVLVGTNIGGHGPVSVLEATLAAALAARGADVRITLCDAAMPACLRAEHADIPDPRILVEDKLDKVACPGCMMRGKFAFEPLGLPIEWLSKRITNEERKIALRISRETPAAEIGDLVYEGLALGEHARAGALRYFARGDLSTEPYGDAVLRRYLESALLSAFAFRRIIREFRPDVAVFHHGLYVPQGILGEVCRAEGVRVVNWVVAYRKHCFVFSHGDTYHHTLMDEPTAQWEDMPWDDSHRAIIKDYLASRWFGTRDWIWFHEQPDLEAAKYLEAQGLDLNKPIIGLLTNVIWDAQLHYPANAFPSLIDWMLRTIEYFATRPDLQLVIRVHPAEIRGTAKSRQPAVDEIRARFPVLPPNVVVIPPESPISTYSLIDLCDSVLIYGTKTGVEITSRGIPTIVAGEAWIRNKGLTIDANSPDHYFDILKQLPIAKKLEPETVDRALRYAFHFFFRRMVPLRFLELNGKGTMFDVAVPDISHLLAGRNAGLDVLCDGILKGAPFIYPAEVVGPEEEGA